MAYDIIQEKLKDLLRNAPVFPLTGDDRIVIFSDLHLGNCTRKDDFRHNALLVKSILKNHYFKKDFRLILNGDIEELQKFSFHRITGCRKRFYNILAEFQKENRLIRLQGNHDYSLHFYDPDVYQGEIQRAVRFDYQGNTLLVFHGHQASIHIEKYNDIYGFFLRYVANPLRIKNRSAAYDSKRRYYIEKQVYRFSQEHKIVSIIGHTHRPLFESLSHVDFVKFQIEQLCRAYGEAGNTERPVIEEGIRFYKVELEHLTEKNKKEVLHNNVYKTDVVLPCVFNSGCAIGKRGVTCLEIDRGRISLVHWFDGARSKKYFEHYAHLPERLAESNYYRMVIKEEFLDYVFTRIKLLA